MIAHRLRSLQLRLAVRLAALFIAGTAAIVGILVYRAYDTADTLNDRELSLRAADLAKYVLFDANGAARLDLPPRLKGAYEAASDADIFAVRGNGGRLISALPAEFGQVIQRWPEATDDPSYSTSKASALGPKTIMDWASASIALLGRCRSGWHARLAPMLLSTRFCESLCSTSPG